MNKIHGPEVAPKLTYFSGLLRRQYEISLKYRTLNIEQLQRSVDFKNQNPPLADSCGVIMNF